MEQPPLIQTSAAAPKKKRRGKLIWSLVVFGILIVVALAFTFRKKVPATTVQTEKVSRHTITETVIANGKIYPVKQVHISAEVSGEIIAMYVKEGDKVKKGDMLLKINPNFTLAALNQAKAGYESSLASKTTAAANLEKAEAEYKRNKGLFDQKLISDSDFITIKVSRDVSMAQTISASNQVAMASAAVDSAQDALNKTTITAPMDGTISKLNSQAGERVLGTVQNAGTDIMIISHLSQMEARVDIGEMDVVLLQAGQKAKLEVDSFKDKKFAGVVTDVASSSEGLNATSLGSSSSSSSQSATQFQVRIRFSETGEFRPGMSVSAEIETRSRTNIIAVPIASVTTRVVKSKSKDGVKTNSVPANTNSTNSMPTNSIMTNAVADGTNAATGGTNTVKKSGDSSKPVEVVFVVEGDHVKTVPVKIGISDDNFWEITDGLKEGDEIVTGGYHAISRDLDDGKKITKGTAAEAAKNQP